MKRILLFACMFAMLFALASCGDKETSTTTTPVGGDVDTAILYQSNLVTGKFSKYDLKDDCDIFSGSIVFSEGTITANGTGVNISGNTVTITTEGCYKISGSTTNGQIIINARDIDKVHLVLNGVSIRCENNAPLWVQNADKVCVTLIGGTVNTFSDGTSFGQGAEDPNAVVYAKDSITFNGSGKLVVNASLHNGISCSNDLKFISGEYEINAAYNGVKGKDSVAILSATMKINAGNDGIKSDEVDDTTKAFVYVAGGNIEITAVDDGIQANTAIDLQGGTFSFACGGKTINAKGAYNIDPSVIIN